MTFNAFLDRITDIKRGKSMIGEVLRISRIANDMSIKEVSQEAQVSVSYITEIEKQKRKNPSTEFLRKVCAAYNLRVSEFLALNDYHDSLIGQKEELETYKLLLMEILKTYEEKNNKVL